MDNPFAERLESLMRLAKRRRLDAVALFDEANVRALTDVACDNACLLLVPGEVSRNRDDRAPGTATFITDFRYIPMLHRVAPWLKAVELKSRQPFADALAQVLVVKPLGAQSSRLRIKRLGYEGSIATSRYLALKKKFPKAAFVDVDDDVKSLRAVKTVSEIAKIAAAEALNDEIWSRAQKDFKPGMTEKDLQRVIRAWMNALGDGEAFETIVCAGANAAECHHVPDDTVWHKGEPLLVDMGVKLDGVCSDMTRCLKPKLTSSRDEKLTSSRVDELKSNSSTCQLVNSSTCQLANSSTLQLEYAHVYDIVLEANRAAIAAAKPGMTCGALDAVARNLIRKAGYGKAFGHSLGHGVGFEIHEEPCARPKSDTVLEPGMLVTIEPGIYLEGKLGVRIEDLVLITTTGCEVLSRSKK